MTSVSRERQRPEKPVGNRRLSPVADAPGSPTLWKIRMFARIISSIGLLAVLSPVHAGDTEEAKVARKAIQQVLNDQVESWNKGDLPGFMAGYLHSKELTYYSGNTVIHGWDALLERYQKRYKDEGKEMGKLTFKDLDIAVLSADAAVVRGRWQLMLAKETPGGLFTLLMRKTADGWRIVHDHTSN
jgi:ketosteroid isomerase-like protein